MEETHRHTFTFQNHKIRTIKRNGSVWFIHADICQALDITDSRGALDDLTPKEMNVVSGQDINDLSEFLLTIISEFGLNKLSHQASKPEAKDLILALRESAYLDIPVINVFMSPI